VHQLGHATGAINQVIGRIGAPTATKDLVLGMQMLDHGTMCLGTMAATAVENKDILLETALIGSVMMFEAPDD